VFDHREHPAVECAFYEDVALSLLKAKEAITKQIETIRCAGLTSVSPDKAQHEDYCLLGHDAMFLVRIYKAARRHI
jgi:hypothetical protein